MDTDKIQIYEEFYRLCTQLQNDAPWNDLDDSQLVGLKRSPGQTVYVNILGNAGNTYGLVFYEGNDGLNDYNLLRTHEDLNVPDLYALFRQNAFCIYFGDDEEIPDEQYDAYAAIQPDFENSEYGIPYVLSLKKGYFPWTPTDAEISQINRYLSWFLDAVRFVLGIPDWGTGMSRGYCLCEYEESEDRWDYSYPPLPDEDFRLDIKAPSDQEIKTAIRNARRTNTVYEADIFFPNIHINDPKFYRPAAAVFVMILDHDSGVILDQLLLEPQEDITYMMNKLLLQAVSRYGIPSRILVRSIMFADMLEHTAEIMHTTVQACKTLEAADEASEALIDMMIPPEDMFS
jgi:hypothetical protein